MATHAPKLSNAGYASRMFLIIGVVAIASVLAYNYYKDSRMNEDSLLTWAFITRLEHTPYVPKASTKTYTVWYTFIIDGVIYTGKESFYPGRVHIEHRNFRVGGEVRIRYKASDPTVNQLHIKEK